MGYLLTMDSEYSVHRDHIIFGSVLRCVNDKINNYLLYGALLYLEIFLSLKMVVPFLTVHTFCASRNSLRNAGLLRMVANAEVFLHGL